MLGMLQAHGLDAGPTQRPLLTRAAAGAAAAVPAIVVLVPFGSLEALGQTAGASPVMAGLACGALMTAGGVRDGWLFRCVLRIASRLG
ncbi:MAG: hypothetical protein K0S56_1090 [Microvirga sp.]|jgi:VIT1/CCC1 family predicted Fe2+/Mn2+ transporter|nr:hypothetical protein [Microvirga sp.]